MSEEEQAPAPAKPKRKRAAAAPVDGHTLIDGARWHYPKQGSPTECAIQGCDRILGAWRDFDPFDDIEADDEDED